VADWFRPAYLGPKLGERHVPIHSRTLSRWTIAGRERLFPAKRLPAPEDGQLVFLMPVFRDGEIAFQCLEALRRCYPTSRVVVLSDGDDSFPGDEARERFSCEYVLGDNLYSAEHGGRMIQRMLDLYAEKPAQGFVRLDSDARMDRPFAYWPQSDGVYGAIGKSGTAQGGCILMTHGAAEKLRLSEVFLSPRLQDGRASWGRYSTKANLQKKIAQKRIAYDKVLHWGCVEAGVPVRPYDEIFSVWKPDASASAIIAGNTGEYAVVHPTREMS
jgi:hypothetical protein